MMGADLSVFGKVDRPDTQANFQNHLTSMRMRKQNEEWAKNAPFRDRLVQAKVKQQEAAAATASRDDRLKGFYMAAQMIEPFQSTNDIQGMAVALAQTGLPQEQQQEVLSLAQNDPIKLSQMTKQVLDYGNRQFGNSSSITAGMREFDYLQSVIDDENSTPEAKSAAKIKQGLMPRASTSAQERILNNPDMVNKAVTFEGDKSSARESGKASAQLKMLPQIERAVTLARKKADEEGTVFNELMQAEAAMPQLLDTVSKLKELAPIATSTIGGKIYDFASKELGFGATDGNTARVKFISTVANQVLPLLKATFGAAFTVEEGKELKATMGDPDMTPEAKVAALEAFVDQKYRNIKTKQTQLDKSKAINEMTDDQLAELARQRGLIK